MSDYTITLSDEEDKAMAGICISVEEWIDNVVHDRARVAIDKYVTQSGLGSKMSEQARKLEIIRDMEIVPLVDSQG